MAIRSGRFRFPNQTAASSSPYTIVYTANKKHAGTLYRVLNSGEIDLKVFCSSTKRKVARGNSLDILVADGGDLKIEWDAPTSPAVVDVQGIYNFLGDEHGSKESPEDIRSGRFSGIPVDATRVLVDLTAGTSKSSAFYRIFNSGTADISLSGVGMTAITLKAGLSVDIALAPRGTLQVDGSAEVDVIYDLLGGVSP